MWYGLKSNQVICDLISLYLIFPLLLDLSVSALLMGGDPVQLPDDNPVLFDEGAEEADFC